MQLDQEFRRELSSIVGNEYVIDDVERLGPYTHDNSPFPSVPPCAVVKPSSAEEISRILQAANARKNKVLVRGGGFSLTGLLPSEPERTVILDTTRLNRIHEIDEQDMVARVECGIILSDLEKELAKRGLYVHTVTVPINYVTLGGVLSGVVGGGLPPRRPVYGTGINFVLGLKVVLPTGPVLSTGAGGANVDQKIDYIKGGNGPDILGVFVGDGGIFGVKVEATLQMFPEPTLKRGECRVFGKFSDAWNVLSKLMSLDTLPFSQLRIVDRGKDYLLEYVIEVSTPHMLQFSLDTMARICKEGGAMDPSVQEREEAKKLADISELRSEKFVRLPRYFVSFMTGRKDFPLIYKELKDFILHEISSKHLEKVGVAVQMAFQPSMRNSMFCTFNIQYDPNVQESCSSVLALGNASYERVIELGGCPQPHQGFGAELLSRYWSKEYREMIFGMKKLLDPNMVLNSNVWGIKP